VRTNVSLFCVKRQLLSALCLCGQTVLHTTYDGWEGRFEVIVVPTGRVSECGRTRSDRRVWNSLPGAVTYPHNTLFEFDEDG